MRELRHRGMEFPKATQLSTVGLGQEPRFIFTSILGYHQFLLPQALHKLRAKEVG